ncbi:MAG: hypothetical protein APF82_02180 [Sphingomonadales bacterium BRH_c42]|nr:MAG: hypothetical protein APF82_02180 [Sphingomonadales bacterium BRH_c42]
MATPPFEIPGIPKFAIELGATPFAIGLFVMEWANHEREIIQIIAGLEGAEYRSVKIQLLDGQLSDFETRLRSAADKVEDQKLRSELNDIATEHSRLREVRNDIVHGHWAGLNDGQRFIHHRKRRGKEETALVFGASEILRERDAILAMHGRTFEALRAIGVLSDPARP